MHMHQLHPVTQSSAGSLSASGLQSQNQTAESNSRCRHARLNHPKPCFKHMHANIHMQSTSDKLRWSLSFQASTNSVEFTLKTCRRILGTLSMRESWPCKASAAMLHCMQNTLLWSSLSIFPGFLPTLKAESDCGMADKSQHIYCIPYYFLCHAEK